VSQSRTKGAVRGAKVKSKSGRRPPVKVKSGPEIPLLPIAVGGILVVVAIVIIIVGVANNSKHATAAAPTVAGVPCDQLEGAKIHYHVGLQIVKDGIVFPIQANTGIVTGSQSCFYWLHVHPANPNTIHIESPANRTFTLGQFFAIWSSWSGIKQGLDATHVSTFTLTPGQSLVVYVDPGDGTGTKLYTGNPAQIVLKPREVITLEITPPTVTPPPPFTFAAGL
jgi:hypothetical protein